MNNLLNTFYLITGTLVSLFLVFRYFIYKPLTSLIDHTVAPLDSSIKELKESIDRLNESSKAEFSSIHKQLDVDDQRIRMAEKNIAVHDEKISNLEDKK